MKEELPYINPSQIRVERGVHDDVLNLHQLSTAIHKQV